MNDQTDPLLLDHEADGIRELDNNLPRWWVWLFYITIIYSVIYLGYYHVFAKEKTSAAEYAIEQAAGDKIKTAFGSDLLFSSTIAERQGIMLTHLARWYDNADILTMATSGNAELLAMSGPRNPYP